VLLFLYTAYIQLTCVTDCTWNQVVKVRNCLLNHAVSHSVTTVSVTHLLAQQITFLQYTVWTLQNHKPKQAHERRKLHYATNESRCDETVWNRSERHVVNDVKIIVRSIMWLQASWRNPLPKVTCTKLLNKFPTLCGTQKFITVLINGPYLNQNPVHTPLSYYCTIYFSSTLPSFT
jgi:hypothetical protein